MAGIRQDAARYQIKNELDVYRFYTSPTSVSHSAPRWSPMVEHLFVSRPLMRLGKTGKNLDNLLKQLFPISQSTSPTECCYDTIRTVGAIPSMAKLLRTNFIIYFFKWRQFPQYVIVRRGYRASNSFSLYSSLPQWSEPDVLISRYAFVSQSEVSARRHAEWIYTSNKSNFR